MEKHYLEIENLLNKVQNDRLTLLVQQLITENHKLETENKNLRKENDILQKGIFFDPLTGFYNRNGLKNIDEYSVIAICSLSGYETIKEFNNKEFGEIVLRRLSQILLNQINHNDFVCRYQENAFLIAFNRCHINDAYARMQNVREESRNIPEIINSPISVIIGLAEVNREENLDDSIERANEALSLANNSVNGIAINERKVK